MWKIKEMITYFFIEKILRTHNCNFQLKINCSRKVSELGGWNAKFLPSFALVYRVFPSATFRITSVLMWLYRVFASFYDTVFLIANEAVHYTKGLLTC